MKLSKMHLKTLREVPNEAEIPSHVLLLRAGMIRKLVSGVYGFMPLGWRSVRKIEDIVRQEMDAAGGQEIHMSAVQPAELWQESGRWNAYGPELWRLKDRNGREFCLGPTHEEIFTDIVRNDISSYRQLPMNLYQIQTKYRDEARPRFGLMRSREFIMKDAYSFDRDYEGLDKSYQEMYDAYDKIFTRCGLTFRPVEADTGAIGGSNSHEFTAISEVGESEIAYCTSCDMAATVERAECKDAAPQTEVEALPLEEVEITTPICDTKVNMLKGEDIAIVPILRAGLGMVDGMLALVPNAKVGHVGLYRDPETHEPVEYYCKLPNDIDKREIFVVDPMLATGGSAAAAIDFIKARGGKKIIFMCLIAAPEGIEALQKAHPDVDIFIAAKDEKLNENAYIVPGLGDAGDRLYGTK